MNSVTFKENSSSVTVPQTFRIVYYEEKVLKLKEETVNICDKCGGEGLVVDKSVVKKLKGNDEDIILFLKDSSSGRVECICQKKFNKLLHLVEANIPINLWTVNRQLTEDKRVKDCVNNKTVSLKETIEKYLKKLNEALDKGIGFVFWGPNGTGKTFFGCKILTKALKKNYSAHYILFPDIIEMLKKFDYEFIYAVVDEISKVDFLFIDEIGKEYKTSQFTLTNLENIIKDRMSSHKPTIFASNLKIEEIQDQYGPSIMSVMQNNNLILSFQGIPDMRNKKFKPKVIKFFED